MADKVAAPPVYKHKVRLYMLLSQLGRSDSAGPEPGDGPGYFLSNDQSPAQESGPLTLP